MTLSHLDSYQPDSPETESPLTSPADEVLSPQTAAMHGSSPFTSSPFGEIDASPSDKDGKDDGVNGNLDVIPSPGTPLFDSNYQHVCVCEGDG